MSHHKLLEFSILTGKTIASYTAEKDCVDFTTIDNEVISINLSDDGDGGNDSYAYFLNFEGMENILHKKIVKADDTPGHDEADFLIELEDGSKATFSTIHEHNGYYGYSYEIELTKK